VKEHARKQVEKSIDLEVYMCYKPVADRGAVELDYDAHLNPLFTLPV